MKHTLLKSLLVSTLFLASHSKASSVPQCPNIDHLAQNITAPIIERQGYRNPFNRIITWLPSFHMIHDQITQAGKNVTITAKFDYGAIAHKDLEHEMVNFYIRGQDDNEWRNLGSTVTNSDGKASMTLSNLDTGQYRLYAGVPADGSGAQGFLTVIDANTQAVLFDIDGTLTQSDLEQIDDYTGLEYADAKEGAYDLVRTYLDLGYQPIFLTARVYWYAKGSREWLSWMGLPQGFLRTSLSNEASLFNTAEYKIEQINQLKSQGVNIIRAYGNAKTDAQAFIQAGLGSDNSFTIGKDAGYYGTQAIEGDSYYQHIRDVASQTPNANCK